MTTTDTVTTIRPGRDTALRWVKQMQPVRVLDGATGRTTMDEGWVIGYLDEPSIAVLRRDGTVGHWSTHLPWQTTGEPPSPEERAALLSRRDQPAVTAEVWAAENARLRSQLAEAREALVRVAKTLGWDVPPEQVPSGIPDLAIAVQELRRQRDQARAALAEARQQRDQAAEALVRAETELDEARAEIARLERAAHEQGADLWIAEDRVDWLRRQVLAVAEDLERYASDLRWEGLERRLAWTLRQIVAGERPACRNGRPAGHCSHCHDDPPAQTVADALDDAVGHLRDMLLRALATTAPETGLSAPQTDEQTQVRTDTHTRAETGSDGPLTPAWCRTQMQRLCIAASESGLRWRDYDVVGAVIAEIDRLRADLDRLRTPRIEDGATVHIDDGRYTVVDVDFRGETAVVTLRPTTTGDSDA